MSDSPAAPCPACGFVGPSLEPGTCGRCGVIFARFHAHAATPIEPPAESVAAEPELAAAPVYPPPTSLGLQSLPVAATEPTTENLWALPAAFGAALFLNLTGLGRVIIFSSAGNWAHELGHASWRWLNGRDAIPLLFLTVYFSPGRSFVTTLLVLGGLGVLFIWARGEECLELQILAVAFLVLFLGCAIFVRPATAQFLQSFAGIFGQFWIATLWIALFYYRFPSVVRWEHLRYAFLFLGAMSLTQITGVFLASRHDMSLLPWGSFWGGDGDLDHLLDGGWLVPKIRKVYFTTAAICFAVVVGHYAYFAKRTWDERGAER